MQAKTPKLTPFTTLAWTVWPEVLPRTWDGPFKPLALGIDKALKARVPDAKHKNLSRLLGKYTASHRYLIALSCKDSWRYDIDGNLVEPVSNAHRAFAIETLARKAKAAMEPSKVPARPILTLRRPAGEAAR